MRNETQLERYKRLLRFIDERFKEDIQINEIEEVSFYSYRNINRIFQSLHNETIGKYIRRLRLEKAAEYLKFSDMPVSDIAYEVGFGELAVFSKAFRNRFGCSPSAFREGQRKLEHFHQASNREGAGQALSFELVNLPEWQLLYLEYRGPYNNITAIEKNWEQLLTYADEKGLISDESFLLAEILDDNEITESIRWRYRSAIPLDTSRNFKSEGLFQTKTLLPQSYVKFVHKGSHESSIETYHRIYGRWMEDVQLEFEDKPSLEIFLNDETDTPEEELLTEIYIPVKLG